MIITYLLNYFPPLIAGKLQVGSTLIKLISLILIGVIGIFTGLTNGLALANYQEALGSVGGAGALPTSTIVLKGDNTVSPASNLLFGKMASTIFPIGAIFGALFILYGGVSNLSSGLYLLV